MQVDYDFKHKPAGRRTAHTWLFQQPLELSAEPCCLWSGQRRTRWRDEIHEIVKLQTENKAALFKSKALENFSTSLLNSFTMCLRRCWSKSSPPRKVSPLVDFTSNTPFWISRTEISNVPPPRSYTAILQTSQLVSKAEFFFFFCNVSQCFNSKRCQLTFYPEFCPDHKPEQQPWAH